MPQTLKYEFFYRGQRVLGHLPLLTSYKFLALISFSVILAVSVQLPPTI